uniref:Uncharacterized protein n=1 Tax=Arundo donax TaxID=35708 RepID=A0A0A9E008_ARUDO
MDRLHLRGLRVVMGSMVTASRDMVHPHLILVHPPRATRDMRNNSLMAMLMAVEATDSLWRTLLKQRHLLHHRINLLPLGLLPQPQHQLLLLLLTVGVPKLLQKVKLQHPLPQHLQASALVSSALLLNIPHLVVGKRVTLYCSPCCFTLTSVLNCCFLAIR